MNNNLTLGLMGICLLLPERMQCEVQQMNTNLEIMLDRRMKITCNKQTMHSIFFCHFHLSPLSWFVLPFSLLTHIQQKCTTNDSPIWIVNNVFLVGIFFFTFYQAPSVWTQKSLRLSWQHLLNNVTWLLPLLCLLPISWIMLFCILSTNLACIPSLQSLFLPSSPLMQLYITSFNDHPFLC